MAIADRAKEQIAWHRSRVADLDIQIAGLRSRVLSPIRVRLREKRANHLKTIKLLEKLC